jgi:hypothetical protein
MLDRGNGADRGRYQSAIKSDFSRRPAVSRYWSILFGDDGKRCEYGTPRKTGDSDDRFPHGNLSVGILARDGSLEGPKCFRRGPSHRLA